MARIHLAATRIGSSIAVMLLLPPLSGVARAQAWTPASGETTVSVMYQNAFYRYHLVRTVRADRGHVQTNNIVVDATYGLTRKVAVDFGVPFVTAKYDGTRPHPTAPDSGSYHGTFQDLRFALRYNLTANRIVLTPFVAVNVPSHDYEFYAHAAAGQRLRSLQIGTYAARLLDPVLPGAFMQARLSYGFVQKVLDIPHNRSNADLEIGYFITPAFRAFALGSAQITHGGVDLMGPGLLPPAQEVRHDQIGRFNYLHVGGGASLSLTDAVDVFGSFVKQMAGRNGHLLDRQFNVGVSFSVPHLRRAKPTQATPIAANERSPYEGSLVRCACQKGM